MLIAAIVRYRTKHFWSPVCVATLGLALSSLVLWLPLTAAYPSFKLKNPLTAEQMSHIAITLPEVTQGPRWNQHFNTNQNGFKSLLRVITIEGVQTPYYAFATGSHTVATLRSGKTLAYDSTDSLSPPPSFPIPDFQMGHGCRCRAEN